MAAGLLVATYLLYGQTWTSVVVGGALLVLVLLVAALTATVGE